MYVDDILLTGNCPTTIQTLISKLNQQFTLKDLGQPTSFFGITITKTTTNYFLSQTPYLQTILHNTTMHECKPVATPLPSKLDLNSISQEPLQDPSTYRQLAGALQYLTINRPDIAMAVNLVCQFMHNPLQCHLQMLKRILRYLKGTMTFRLLISPGDLQLTTFSDADWAGDSSRRSTTGYCTFLGSTLVSWCVQKQRTVARSSTEAEYCALASAATDVLWLQRLIHEFDIPLSKPTTIFCDNISAMAIANNPIFRARTKHIEVYYHFLRDHIASKHVSIHHISSQEQTADILTKCLPTSRFQHLRLKLTVQPLTGQLAGAS